MNYIEKEKQRRKHLKMLRKHHLVLHQRVGLNFKIMNLIVPTGALRPSIFHAKSI